MIDTRIIAALDVGLKRIGTALMIGPVCTPSTPILRKNREQAASDVSLFLAEHRVALLIVGLPKGGASEEEMKRRITHFISLLSFEGEIIYIDEYGSSKEAQEEGGYRKIDPKSGKRDSLAALVILRRYIDSIK